MSRKPLIGLNADYRSQYKETPSFLFLWAGYFDALIDAGATPIVIPPLPRDAELSEVLDLLDGVVLTGGADLDPRRDCYEVDPTMILMDPRREDFDRRLMRQIAMRRLPVLGIGAGMQLLNVVQGGTLFFDIKKDISKALPHIDGSDPNHRHALVVEKGTLLDRVYGEGEIRVNSMHHMAIDQVAPGFMVSARCPDGVIEAIESTSEDWLAIGTQFHPEAPSASILDKRIFEEFIAGITGTVALQERMVA